MKNQNDLIVMIVAIVLGLGFSIAFFFMKREPIAPAAPQQVVTTKLALPAADPVMANGLGGGSTSGGGFGGGRAGGPPMGMPGGPMSGPMSGGPMGAPSAGGRPAGPPGGFGS